MPPAQSLHVQLNAGSLEPFEDSQPCTEILYARMERQTRHWHECLDACRGHGRAIVLCVGGAREALLAEQDQFQIVLGRRLVRKCPA